jgi:hypothetical protein
MRDWLPIIVLVWLLAMVPVAYWLSSWVEGLPL